MHLRLPARDVVSNDENKTRTSHTIEDAGAPVTPSRAGGRPTASCVFVVRDTWRYGEGDPFCGRPAVAGSAYCAPHHALCRASPRSLPARRALALPDDAPPPPGLAPRELLEPGAFEIGALDTPLGLPEPRRRNDEEWPQ